MMSKLLLIAACMTLGLAPGHAAAQANAPVSFTLKKGKQHPVCHAYLERLNQFDRTGEDRPPYCGRPESSRVEGFSVLNRIPVTADEYNRLMPLVLAFTHPEESWTAGKSERCTPLSRKPSQGNGGIGRSLILKTTDIRST